MFHPATYQENHSISAEKPSETFFHDAIPQQRTLFFSHLRNFCLVQIIQQFNPGTKIGWTGKIQEIGSVDLWIPNLTGKISDLLV